MEDISTSGTQYLDLRILGGLIERVLASYVIGVLELATAIALIAGAYNPIAIGAAA